MIICTSAIAFQTSLMLSQTSAIAEADLDEEIGNLVIRVFGLFAPSKKEAIARPSLN
ncbi:MAG: hypothetical protein HC890_06360 [Chloroflexaceae bacterium]|nr:hypothetical protein [Chloroflexaceae bacterium]